MLEIVSHQRVVLQVPLNGIKLDHRIGDWRSGGKHRATPSGQFVQVPAFHKEVTGFHRFGLGDAAHIPHFRIEEKVLVVMALVYKEPIHTQLLKGHNIVLFGLVVELIELLPDGFFSAFQLLDREVISTVLFQFRNPLRHLIKLLFKDRPLPFNGHRYLLKLRMPDDNGVVVAGSDSAAEFFAVLGFKVFLRCHQNVG